MQLGQFLQILQIDVFLVVGFFVCFTGTNIFCTDVFPFTVIFLVS